MRKREIFFTLCILLLASVTSVAGIIHVPADYQTIQAGIDAASDGDTVLVAPGEYVERLLLDGKTITLASWFLTTGDTSYIRQTVIDGGGSRRAKVITITSTVGPETTIMGFTIQNAGDGIQPEAKFRLLYNRIINCKDGIDYEEFSGGICRYNIFENNKDDGIDLDDFVDIVIEDNIIRNNEDDGIEVRLHAYDGPLLTYVIRRNIIYGNEEDGIQLIDYPDTSSRVFYIENNLIYDNAMAGLGCMSRGNSNENYEGASIPEVIYLFNNTFANNNHGVTGGDNMVALNNLVIGSEVTAMKNVDGNSIVAHSGFWMNGVDFDNVNREPETLLFEDPRLDEEYRPTDESPCIDRGTAFFVWQGDTVLNLSPEDYVGSAPDIGAFEYTPAVNVEERSVSPKEFLLMGNYPNPFNGSTTIEFRLRSSALVQLGVYTILGQRVKIVTSGRRSAGMHRVGWNGTDAFGKKAPSGVYLCRLEVKDPVRSSWVFADSRKMILLR